MERKMSSSRRHLLLLLFSLAPALLLYLFALRSTQPVLHLPLVADDVQPPQSAVDSAATRIVGDGGNDLILVQGGGVSLGKEKVASQWNATASQAPLMEKVEVERTSWSASFSVQEAAMEDAARGAVQPPCDVNDGRWVWDESYPLYDGSSCPFIDDRFSCQANGRTDQSYTKWRWQPTHCSVPRFDARKTLEMLRGKRLALVGDSIGRNQWESIMCLLRGAVSDPTRIRQAGGHRFTKKRGHYNFRFLDYNCSVEYHMAHFLVSEGNKRGDGTETFRIDTIARSSPKWIGADVLVFNTGHWWSHRKTKAGVNYYQEGDVVHPYLEANTAYRRALTTWASWIDNHIDPLRTQVFFRTSAPTHYRGGEWDSGGHCRESTMPIDGVARARRQLPVPEKNAILEQVVKHMKTPVTIMDIVFLSRLRVDGHPSVYGRKRKKMGGVELSVQDCSHWCLPGVPDTWNELLFYHLAAPSQKH